MTAAPARIGRYEIVRRLGRSMTDVYLAIDTVENRKEYPLTYNQKPGTGFPVARIGAIISLACGAIVNLGICRYAGKGQSELGMLRKLWGVLHHGDVLVADRLMCAWTEMVMLQRRGVDCVVRFTSHRTADFRRGMRLGKDDHIVKWMKPTKPRSIAACWRPRGSRSPATSSSSRSTSTGVRSRRDWSRRASTSPQRPSSPASA